MRPFASIVWVMVLSMSTFVSGVLPAHAPWTADHALAGPSTAMQVSGDNPYPGYAPGYGPYAPCQINPNNQLPPNWPAAPAAGPFTSTFDQFLKNTVRLDHGSAPYPIAITQEPTTNITPRSGFSMPYQLLYNKQYPGPTIRVVSEQTDNSTLQIESDTTTNPPPLTQLAINNEVVGQVSSLPAVPFPFFTTHLHGGHTAPEHDGHPDDLLPPMPVMSGGVGSAPPPAPAGHIYSYTNDQQPQILWYHDHADMNTSPHVSDGLFAFYIIEETLDDPLRKVLPLPAYDIPIGMQAMQAGSVPAVAPPDASGVVPTLNPPDQTLPVYFVAVNGLDSPKLDVEERFYRFRLLNASAGQSISLELCDAEGNRHNDLVWIIGTDGGLMPEPLNLAKRTIDPFHDGRLDLFQAERYDLLIDFTGLQGKQLYLSAVIRGGNACMAVVTVGANKTRTCVNQETPMLQFNVGAIPAGAPAENVKVDQIRNPSWDEDTDRLRAGHPDLAAPDRVFSFDFGEENVNLVISGQPFSPFRITNSGVKDASGNTIPFPQVIKPAMVNANAVETWQLTNTVACATHPVHVHDVEFQTVEADGTILDNRLRRQFGWKDVFVLLPVYDSTSCPWAPVNTLPSISFIGYYESHWTQATAPPTPQVGATVPWFQSPQNGNWTALTSGTYVFHCHNLFHEDNVMMGQFQVLPPATILPTVTPTPTSSSGAERAPPAMGSGHGG